MKIDQSRTRRFWDSRARKARDPRSVTLDRIPAWLASIEVRLYQQWLFRRLRASGMRAATAVDVACGNGQWTRILAREAGHVVAMDFSPKMLGACATLLEAEGVREKVELVHAALPDVDLPRSDVIVAGAVTQYLDDEDVEHFFDLVAGALAPDGLFYFRTSFARRERLAVRRNDFHGIYRTLDWYDERLRRRFDVVDAATATTFVPDELAHALRWPLGAIVRRAFGALWRWARRRNQADVIVYLCRRKVTAQKPTPKESAIDGCTTDTGSMSSSAYGTQAT